MPVTFFDELAQLVEKQFASCVPNNLYVIISCARVGRYESHICIDDIVIISLIRPCINKYLLKISFLSGIAHLSNYPATRVFVNPIHYSVATLKRRWQSLLNLFSVVPKYPNVRRKYYHICKFCSWTEIKKEPVKLSVEAV